jgi:hypothetical protein
MIRAAQNFDKHVARAAVRQLVMKDNFRVPRFGEDEVRQHLQATSSEPDDRLILPIKCTVPFKRKSSPAISPHDKFVASLPTCLAI